MDEYKYDFCPMCEWRDGLMCDACDEGDQFEEADEWDEEGSARRVIPIKEAA